jgi:hypothetical protein
LPTDTGLKTVPDGLIITGIWPVSNLLPIAVAKQEPIKITGSIYVILFSEGVISNVVLSSMISSKYD